MVKNRKNGQIVKIVYGNLWFNGWSQKSLTKKKVAQLDEIYNFCFYHFSQKCIVFEILKSSPNNNNNNNNADYYLTCRLSPQVKRREISKGGSRRALYSVN